MQKAATFVVIAAQMLFCAAAAAGSWHGMATPAASRQGDRSGESEATPQPKDPEIRLFREQKHPNSQERAPQPQSNPDSRKRFEVDETKVRADEEKRKAIAQIEKKRADREAEQKRQREQQTPPPRNLHEKLKEAFSKK